MHESKPCRKVAQQTEELPNLFSNPLDDLHRGVSGLKFNKNHRELLFYISPKNFCEKINNYQVSSMKACSKRE